MARDMRAVAARYDALKRRYADRDFRMMRVYQVRSGNADLMMPGLFPKDWPKPVVANFIDTVARDLAEVIAPLPAINCNPSNVIDDRSRTRADKRTEIANWYVEASRLEMQLFSGADQYLTYGFLPFRVEAHMDEQRPHIHVDDPLGGYPEFDRWGNTTAYAKRWMKPASELAALFPEHTGALFPNGRSSTSDAVLEVVKWYDDESTSLFVPDRSNLVLASVPNPLGRCPVVCVVRPGVDDDPRGQFDDVLWVQLARAKMALLKIDAAHKSVEAPIALPTDVQHLAIGGDAIIRSANPEKIRRVPLDIPAGAFQEEAALEREMRLGARYPEGRTGNIDASLVTGRGVQALMGGFDTQVRTAQAVIGYGIQKIIELCFEVDEKVWGGVTKDISGIRNGQPYQLRYRPDRDIRGEYMVDVSYGLMAGLDPNRALVWGLQARADKLISRSFLRRNLPVSMNVSAEEQIIDIEDGRDALKQALAGYVQALPVLAQNGQDPSQVVKAVAKFIQSRKKGETLEDAIEDAFEPPEPVEDAENDSEAAGAGMEAQDQTAGAPGAGGPGGPLQDTGLMQGVAPGQAGMPAGGRPDLRYVLAGLSSGGSPQMTANVVRRQPV